MMVNMPYMEHVGHAFCPSATRPMSLRTAAGMTCAACVGVVENALKGVAGVNRAAATGRCRCT